jgi:hypothetical protein
LDRVSDGPDWPQDLEQAAALLREVPLDDAPGWWLALADRRRTGDVRYDWAWKWAAEVIAACHPERLLPFLTALRSIPVDRKQLTLDAVGERLAVGWVEQPTLAACRSAIAEPDEAPRRRTIFSTGAAPPNIDTALIAVVLDALGCADESLSRTSESGPGREFASPGFDETADVIQHRVVTSRWHSASCTVHVERTETRFPGDVNQPARELQEVWVSGTRRGEASLTMHARIGDSNIEIDVEAAPDERDRMLATFWRAFGRPHRRPQEEWTW